LNGPAQRKAFRRGVMEGINYAHASDRAEPVDAAPSQPEPSTPRGDPPADSMLRPGYILGAALGGAIVVGGIAGWNYLQDKLNQNIMKNEEELAKEMQEERLRKAEEAKDIGKQVEQENKEKVEAIA